ncbi:SHOCT domain-containing protein [Kitasatospora sp. NPDC059795]|uniref:SHOCT domain-containing protein n=1 Tax=Kitasatospora sp. NPDC059795 TaxID=3346949 RepID=UPI00365CD618
MYWHHGYHGGWSWVLPGITFMLFVLLAIVVLAALWRMFSAERRGGTSAGGPRWGNPPQGRVPEAERLLAERLARGEIDVDEYRHRLAALRGEHGGGSPPGGSSGSSGPGDPGKS